MMQNIWEQWAMEDAELDAVRWVYWFWVQVGAVAALALYVEHRRWIPKGFRLDYLPEEDWPEQGVP
jgi:hypothetical protein